jgi:hypothetical protein
MWFLVHPQNGFNGLIFNWCIGGCWIIPSNNMQASRVNMPPTKHHPVTKHLFWADQCW